MFMFMLKPFVLRNNDGPANGGAGTDDAGGGGNSASTTTGAEPRADQGQPPAAPSGGQQGQQTNQTQQPPTAQPYAVFPTPEALSERLDRAQKQGVSQFLQELGFEDSDGLKTLVTAAREREEAEKSETEKLQGKLDKALEEAQGLKAQNEQLAVDLRREREDRLVERQAVELGFADVTDAASLVDRSRFEYSDEGQIKAPSVKTALEALLEAKPHLRGSSRPAPAIDAQAGTGKGPAAPQNAKDYSAHLPARLRSRQPAAGVAQQ